MTAYVQAALAALAIGVAFWPQIRDALGMIRLPAAADEPTPSYRDAIYHLAQVRLRLRSTQLLDDARKKAFDSLTLALVEGSDQ
jgi:hypothetical protein